MATSIDYIKKYGNNGFDELPFNDIDNIALCEILYMPFEKVLSDSFNEEPVPFSEACQKMFKYNGNRHVAPGLVLMKKISVKMMAMAKTDRFGSMMVLNCKCAFDVEPPLQFGAMTFLLPDGTAVVVFRGTDDSLIGWKEDMSLYTRKGIPSHALAVEYLENVAKHCDGNIIICGHSKGGNLALYSAVKCSEETRKRIARLYNNDGPGFVTDDLMKCSEYKELLPNYRHFVPSNSFIGMLLVHDNDFKAVRCKHFLGFIQHDLSLWRTKGTEILFRDDISKLAKITDEFLKQMIYRVTDDQGQLIDKWLGDLITGMGQDGLMSISRNLISSVKGAVKVCAGVDSDTKAAIDSFVGGLGKIAVNSTKFVLRNAANVAENGMERIAEAVLA